MESPLSTGAITFEDAAKALKAAPSKWFSTAQATSEHTSGESFPLNISPRLLLNHHFNHKNLEIIK